MSAFSFDYWAKLYELDPEEFERKRKTFLEDEILKSPVEIRNKLRVCQWNCDVVRTNKSPIDATIALTRMMADSMTDLTDHIIDLMTMRDKHLAQLNELDK